MQTWSLDELWAQIEDGPVVCLMREHSPSDSISSLYHHYIKSEIFKLSSGDQPCNSSPDDNHFYLVWFELVRRFGCRFSWEGGEVKRWDGI